MVKKKSHRHDKRLIPSRIRFILGILTVISLVVFVVKGFTKSNTSGGWRYVFMDEISLQKALPEEFNTLSVRDTSVYMGLTNGFTYSLNRNTGSVQWKHEEQDTSIYPAAFYENNTMILTNFDGRLYSLNTITGKEVWRFTIPGLLKIDTEPVISEGVVFFGSRDGFLYAVDVKTGELQWSYKTKGVDISRYNPNETILHFGRFSVDERNVYINSSTENSIISLDNKTGKEIWRVSNYGFLFQKPVIYDKNIAFLNNAEKFFLVDKSNGVKIYEAHILSKFIYKGDHLSYQYSRENAIDAIDSATGKRLWSFPTWRRPDAMIEFGVADLAVAVPREGGAMSTIALLDSETGKTKWNNEINESTVSSILFNDSNLFVIGKNLQCAFDRAGNQKWCRDENKMVTDAYVTTNGIYAISTEDKIHFDIFYLDGTTGERKWQYSTKDFDANVVKVNGDNLFFISKDKKSVFMLKHDFHSKVMEDKHLTIHKGTDGKEAGESGKDIFRSFKNFVSKLIRPQIVLSTAPTTVPLYENFELSLSLEENFLEDKYDGLQLTGIFTDKNGKSTEVKGFYYDQNTWKLRFQPYVTGEWTWRISIRNSSIDFEKKGTFEVTDSDKMGFVSISKEDPRSFVDEKGRLFELIGLQDCTSDLNQDGDPLNQWFVGSDVRKILHAVEFPAVSMETYLSTYRDTGFNMFRWGAENCSFPLWKTISPSGNRYGVNEGMRVDTLFSSLRNHGFHIWMSLFSFTLPFEGKISEPETKDALRKYLDYVVARYGSYVDVWELANEIKLEDDLITFMSDYIRSIDPYHHPITTSWERPELSSIDISSVHWYSQICTLCHYDDLNHQVSVQKSLQKPVVYSEHGNWQTNWDRLSAARLRIRLWVGFFEKLSYIYWNTSREFWINVQGTTQGPSNIYLGSLERQYVSVFSRFIQTVDSELEEHTLLSDDKIYARKSGNQIVGYIYHPVLGGSEKQAVFTIAIPQAGKIQWINTEKGDVISEQTLQFGIQALNSPSFSTDIAFKISFDPLHKPEESFQQTTFDIVSYSTYSVKNNSYSDWSNLYSQSTRVRLWVGFFEKKAYTLWDAPRWMWLNVPWSTDGPLVLPLDVAEGNYASVFNTFIKDLGDRLTTYPIGSPDKVYGFISGSKIVGYVYKQIVDGLTRPTELYIFSPYDGKIQWISPETGAILKEDSVRKGSNILTSPLFSMDVAFRLLPVH